MIDWENPQPPSLLCSVDLGRLGLDAVTGGGYELGKYAYDKTYGKAASEQKNAYNQAGDDASALGKSQRDWYAQQGNQALSYFSGGDNAYANGGTGADSTRGGYNYAADHGLPDPNAPANRPISPDQALMNEAANRPQQQQDYFDYMKGQAGGLTNEEQLYNERKSGNDPAAAYQDQQAYTAINRQLAARGRYNSTPGVRQITDYQANANAQRSQQLASLAGGADSSRLGVDNAYGNAASGASGEQSKYFNDLMNNSQSLAQAKADTFGHYSDEGGAAFSQGQMAKIEAQMQAAGVDAATIHQFVTDWAQIGTGVVKTATSGKGG